MINAEEGSYEYVRAVVTEGGIQLRYQCSELDRPGSDFIDDESANTWTDDDIRKVVAQQLGITGDLEAIEVIFD